MDISSFSIQQMLQRISVNGLLGKYVLSVIGKYHKVFESCESFSEFNKVSYGLNDNNTQNQISTKRIFLVYFYNTEK